MLEIDDIAAVVASSVKEATAPLIERIAVLEARQPEKGDPGEPGDAGEKGADGKDGANGRDGLNGKDGAGIADLLRDHEGNLVATFTDGRLKNLGPIQGKDGRDGITPEFMDANFEGRVLRLEFSVGDTIKSVEFDLPCPEYRGVWKEAESYERGDMVTWGGSLWHCDKATAEKPGTDDWTLAAKKGRDGKDKS